MITSHQSDLLIFLAIVIFGVMTVGLTLGKPRRKRFSVKRYLLHLLFPMLGIVFAYYKIGTPVLYIFVVGAVAGLVLEYLVGLSFSIIEGTRLWRYYRYDISGNTSWLVLPLWGMAGVMCMLIARAVI